MYVSLHLCSPSKSFHLGLKIHSLYSWKNKYDEITRDLSQINFHLRTLIFVFALNFYLQSVFDSSNGFFWTLSADTEFPWEDRYRIKTDQPFPKNVAGQRKTWNKCPFKCVLGDIKVISATSLQKSISSYISFSKKPEIRGKFSSVPWLQYLKSRNFCDHKLLPNLF